MVNLKPLVQGEEACAFLPAVGWSVYGSGVTEVDATEELAEPLLLQEEHSLSPSNPGNSGAR